MLGFSALSEIALSEQSGSVQPQGIVSLPAIFGTVQAVGAHVAGSTAAASMLGASAVVGSGVTGWASAAAILGSGQVVGSVPMSAWAAAPTMLGAQRAIAYHDFTDAVGDSITTYVMDLDTPGGLVRVPISSWQATLQTGAKNYVQGVVPAVADWIDAINDATEFVITRAADTSVGRIEYEMARAPLEQISIARGPTNYTATLSGYSTAFAENEEPDAAYDRTLTGIRSTTTGTAATRVRCAIDWLLRPGQRAYYDEGASFVVSYINYYVPATGDAYMDVGE